MNRLKKLVMCSAIGWGAFVGAPRGVAQAPLTSGVGPEIDVHGGFAYIGQQVPSASNVPMYGADSGVTFGISHKLGIRADFGYARAGNVFSSGKGSDILSYMGGPVFYPVRTRRLAPYAELLLGGARVSGLTLDGQGGYIRGYANQFAWAGGGGVEIQSSRSMAFRIGADYLHAQFFDSTKTLSGEGNIRATVGFIYYFGGRRR